MFKKIRSLILIILFVIAVKYALGSNTAIEMNFNKENVPLPESVYEKADFSCCLYSITNVKDAVSDFIDSLKYWFSFYAKVGD